MSDLNPDGVNQQNFETPEQPREGGGPTPAKGHSFVSPALACLAVALAIVSLVMHFLPPSEFVSEQAASPSTSSPAAPEPPLGEPTASSPSQPTVSLAVAAVPGTAEQLQDEAKQVAEQLRQRFPETAEALHVAAMLHSQLRQTAEAEALWKKCIELDPKHEGHYVNLAAIAMDRGDSQLAADTLEQAIAIGCKSPDVEHHLAIAYMRLGRCEQAEANIQKALASHPKAGEYWLVLGQAQLKQGKTDEAEASLRKAIDLGAQTPETFFALGNACARNGKSDEAAEYRKKFAELKSSQPLNANQRYQVLSTAEARRTAMTVLLESATVYSWKGDFPQAESLYLRVVALDPTRPEPCLGLATLYHDAGMLAEERAVRQRLAELDPNDVLNHLMLAKTSAKLGENRAAEASLKLAAAIAPGSVAVQASLAQFYLQTAQAQKARWHAQQAVQIAPSAEGYRFLASTCRLVGDSEAADAALAKASKLSGGESESP